MNYPRLQNHVRKVCALAAATLILPTLAHASDHYGSREIGEHRWGDHDKGWKDRDMDKNECRQVSAVPEANTGMVLLPFVGAVLLFSSLQLFRAKAAQKSGALY